MIDRLKAEITQLLHHRPVAHLALSGPDGPWACVVHFLSAGLTLYLIELRASDLIYYVENNPETVLTVDSTESTSTASRWESVQIFGYARILAPHELPRELDEVQTAYSFKNQQAPGLYVIIEVKPRRVHRIRHENGSVRQDTIDTELAHGEMDRPSQPQQSRSRPEQLYP